MKFKCAITGTSLQEITIFPSELAFMVHPFFQLPKGQIARMVTSENLTHKEKKLLFLASLYASGLVTFEAPIAISELPIDVVNCWQPTCLQLMYTKESTKEQLASFRTSSQCVDQLIQWLKVVSKQLKLRELQVAEDSETPDLLELEERLAYELEERERLRRAIAAAKNARKLNLPTLISWAIEQLRPQLSPDKLRYVEMIVQNYKTYPLSAIKEVKYLMLDYLPERSHSDLLRKEEVTQFLSNVIVDKANLMAQMASSEDERREAKRELAEIHDTFVIVSNDKQFTNSAVPVAAKVKAIMSDLEAAPATKAVAEIAVPKVEPKREDYSNALAYQVALRKWESQK